jgi:hypothetical protein
MDTKSFYRDGLNFYFLPKKQIWLRKIVKTISLYPGSPKPELTVLIWKKMNSLEQGLGYDDLIRVSFSESNHTSEISDFIKLLEDRNFENC